MDRKSIAKILRDFGKDYAAAAEWVADDIIAAHETLLLMKLAAAEEQLAEMREAVEELIVSLKGDDIQVSFETAQAIYGLREALSAAPKRGRVVAQETVRGHYRHWPLADHSDLMLYAHGFVPHMYISVPHSEAEKQRKAEFTVTVREAE